MVTPFTDSGELDEPAVHSIIEHLLDADVDGVFVLGTTGEAQSIPAPARLRLVELATTHVAGRATVYAGIASNCFADPLDAATSYYRYGRRSCCSARV